MATKEYTNGEVTVVWKSDLCIHSERCFHGLPEVFNPNNRPWINAQGAPTDKIVEQVSKCPSGALSYYLNADGKPVAREVITEEQIVEVTPNGPLMVYGNLKVKLTDGSEATKNKVTAFCRCGGSSNKPFCDGTHKKNGFVG